MTLTLTVAAAMIGVAIALAVALRSEHDREPQGRRQQGQEPRLEPRLIVYFTWLCAVMVLMTVLLLWLAGVEFEFLAALVGVLAGVVAGVASYWRLRRS